MIYYYFYEFIIGTILIAEEKNAIIRIDFADRLQLHSDNEQEEQVPGGCQYRGEEKEFIMKETPCLAKTAKQLGEYFAGTRKTFDIALNPQGTVFQKKIWQQLLQIRYGEVASYGAIASAAGCPKGARAVGMACNKNPIMILIPCHRVIGAGGSLTGYAGGLKAKEQLLKLEKFGFPLTNGRNVI